MDNIGPEKIISGYNREFRFRWFVVIDNTAMGKLAKGGTMMAPGLTADLIARKARGMTLKNALAGLPLGGGKSGIVFDPRSPEKEKIVRAFARDIKFLIDAGIYVPGMDVGINESDVKTMARELKNPRAATGARVRYDELGITGYGVVEAVKAAAKIKKIDLAGATAAIQGFGAVGKAAAKFLAEIGTRIIAVSDSKTALFEPDGLDIQKLLKAKENGGLNFYDGAFRKMKLGEELFVPTDIICLAAKEDVLTGKNAGRVKTKIIAEGANMPTTAEVRKILAKKGILVAPDIIANSGGIIAAYCELFFAREKDEKIIERAFKLAKKIISKNAETILARAFKEKRDSKDLAAAIALDKLNLV